MEPIKQHYLSDENISALCSVIKGASDRENALNHLAELKKLSLIRKHKKEKQILLWSISSIAAAVVVLVSIVGVVEQVSMPHEYMVEVKALPGENNAFNLSDGTTVWLNSNSSLKYPNRFSKRERKVELTGEAFFDVERNEEIPFVVEAGECEIRVVGTKFNVFAYDSDCVRTDLVEGVVQISVADSVKVVLKQNESLLALAGEVTKSRLESTAFLDLQKGIYTFDDITFDEISKRLELYFGTEVNIENETLKQHKFSGKVRLEDGLEGILKTMKKIYRFDVEFENNKIIIS